MTFFDKYVEALNKGDIEALAALFADDICFRDWGGRGMGMRKELCADGIDQLRKMYAGVFAGGPPVVTMVKQNKNSMEYDVKLGKFTLPVIGCAGFDENGLVNEYIVRPR